MRDPFCWYMSPSRILRCSPPFLYGRHTAAVAIAVAATTPTKLVVAVFAPPDVLTWHPGPPNWQVTVPAPAPPVVAPQFAALTLFTAVRRGSSAQKLAAVQVAAHNLALSLSATLP